MPEINTVAFHYEPVNGDLLFDAFRTQFHTERVGDIQDTLQFLCFYNDVARTVAGEIRFSDADDTPPRLSGLQYESPTVRYEHGHPFGDDTVTLWETGGAH